MASKRYEAALLRRIRAEAGASGKPWPVVVTGGDASPRLRGWQSYYVNKSGAVITYPNAYRKAWGKPIYVASTIRVEVGRRWLDALRRLGPDAPSGVVFDCAIDGEGVTA